MGDLYSEWSLWLTSCKGFSSVKFVLRSLKTSTNELSKQGVSTACFMLATIPCDSFVSRNSTCIGARISTPLSHLWSVADRSASTSRYVTSSAHFLRHGPGSNSSDSVFLSHGWVSLILWRVSKEQEICCYGSKEGREMTKRNFRTSNMKKLSWKGGFAHYPLNMGHHLCFFFC